jgi:hypothetical protein
MTVAAMPTFILIKASRYFPFARTFPTTPEKAWSKELIRKEDTIGVRRHTSGEV